MATRFSLHLLLVALTLSTTLLRPISTSTTIPHPSSPPTNTIPHSSSPPTTTTTTSPPHSPSKPPSPQPPPPKPTSPPPPNPSSRPTPNPSSLPPPPPLHTLLETIVSALLGAGDFRYWATLLAAEPSTLPRLTTATLFVPSDQALSHFSPTPTPTTSPISFDPFLIPYHIIPQRLPFSDLQLFQNLTRLPTLLPANSILISRNSQSNFSVDGSQITHPDLYVNSAVAVHGVANVLDYSVYGGDGQVSPPPPPARKSPEMAPCCGRMSGAAGWGGDELIVFVVVCAAVAFKILQATNGGC